MGTRDTTVPPLGGRRLSMVDSSVRSLHENVVAAESVADLRRFRFALLATLNALDLLTTAVVLRLGGAEANPMMAPHIESLWRPLAIKCSILAAVWVALSRLPQQERAIDRLVQLAIVVYGIVVVHNTLLYLSAG